MSSAIIGVTEFLLCLVMFLGSLAMLILGLVKRVRGLWIAGAVLMGVSMIISVAALIFFIGVSRNMSHTDDYAEEPIYTDPVEVQGTFSLSPQTDSLMHANFEAPIDYSWESVQGPTWKVPFFAHKKMKDKGITLITLKGMNSDVGDEGGVAVVLKLDRDYLGRMMLEAYGNDETLLGSWSQKIDGKTGQEVVVPYNFNSTLYMQDIYYCTLTAFE